MYLHVSLNAGILLLTKPHKNTLDLLGHFQAHVSVYLYDYVHAEISKTDKF